MTISTLSTMPEAPSRSDPDNFSVEGDAFLAAIKVLETELNVSIPQINSTAATIDTAVTNAQTAESNAQTAETAAVAAGNLLGAWSSQTGSQNKPASVTHNGSLWALLNNLADITASEPGVSGDWYEIKVISATTETVTASGSVSIGDLISINTDETGSAVAQTDAAVSANAISTFEDGDMSTYPLNKGSLIYVEDDAALVLIYNDPGAGTYLRAFTTNSDTGVLTAGSPVQITAQECAGYAVAYGTVNDQIVATYSYGGNLYARNYTLTGTTLAAVTTEVSLEADNADNMVLVHDASYTTNDRFWLFYRAIDHANAGYYLDITNTSGTLTDSGAAGFETGATLDIDACYVGNGIAVVTWIDDADTDTPKSCFAGWSAATTAAIGSVFELTADSAGGTCVTYDSTENLVTWFYYNETSSTYECVVMPPPGAYNGTVSSNDYEAQQVTTSFSHQSDYFDFVYEPSSQLYYYFYDGSSNTGEMTAFARDGGVLVEESSAQFEGGTTTLGFSATVDTTDGFPVIAYVDGAATGVGRMRTVNPPTTDMNMWRYRGIATTAAADAASFTLQISGVNTNQTGLTAGQDYWCGTDGSLVAYPVGPYVGRARSATSIDLDAKNPSAQVLKKFTSSATFPVGTPVRVKNNKLAKMGVRGKLNAVNMDIDSVAEDTLAWAAAGDHLMQAQYSNISAVGYDRARGVMCVAYHYDSSNGAGTDFCYLSVFDVTDLRNPVHISNQSIQTSVTPYHARLKYYEELDRWMLSYVHSGNAYLYYHQFTVDSSFNYTSLHTATNVNAIGRAGLPAHGFDYDPDENAWVAVWDITGSRIVTAYIAQDNGGGVLTFGSAQTVESSSSAGSSAYFGVSIAYDPTEQVWHCMYNYSGSNYLRTTAFTVNGSARTITKGSAQYCFATSTNCNWPLLTYVPALSAVVATRQDNSNNIYAEVHTATGTSISITSGNTDTNQNSSGYSSYDFSQVLSEETNEILYFTFGGFYLMPINYNSLQAKPVITTSTYVTGEGANYGAFHYDPVTRICSQFSGLNSGNPAGGDSLVHYSYVYDYPTTDANEFVGVIGHATKPGAETSVVLSGLLTGYSGLTPNKDYYVNQQGEISLVDFGYGKVGKAISATEIVI